MPRTLIADLGKHIGSSARIMGSVSVRRDQGKMVFFDFRDRSGAVQGVVLPSEELAIAVAKEEVETPVVMDLSSIEVEKKGKKEEEEVAAE